MATQASTIDELVRISLAATPAPQGAARRGQHPKQTACVTAIFCIREDIPAELQHGLFAHRQAFRALIRFSNGRAQDDRKADAHGMAIKVCGVDGPKLAPGREAEKAQDFILVDHETFFTGHAQDYLLVHIATLAKSSAWQRAAAIARLLIRHFDLVRRVFDFTSKRPTCPLGSYYFSATPYALGSHAVKYVVRPQGARPSPRPMDCDGLSARAAMQVANEVTVFDFGVDLQVDSAAQPIEDPSVAWSTATGARRVWLARIVVPCQDITETAAIGDDLAFSPWHSLEAHRPLGFINDSRKQVYAKLGARRQAANGISPSGTSECPRAAI